MGEGLVEGGACGRSDLEWSDDPVNLVLVN